MDIKDEVIILGDGLEVHPGPVGFTVVRNGRLYGSYPAQREAVAIALDLATAWRKYTYTIRTDAVLWEGAASDADAAAKLFARDEFPGDNITDVASLFDAIERIGDGAWCWIEGKDAPDGERQSVGCLNPPQKSRLSGNDI